MFCYEFWALYFPATLALFVLKRRSAQGEKCGHTALQWSIVALYLLGTYANAAAIFWTPNISGNRDAMLGIHLDLVWGVLLGVVIFFCAVVAHVAWWSWAARRLAGQDGGESRFLARVHRRLNKDAALIGSCALMAAVALAIHSSAVAVPSNSYYMRSIGLILPLLFSLTLVNREWCETPQSGPCRLPDRLMTVCLIGALFITVHTRLHQTHEWKEFKRDFFQATQEHSGYVPLAKVRGLERESGWFWTYSVMSVLLQAMEDAPIKSIVYNSKISWQPFGPADQRRAEKMAHLLGVPFEAGSFQALTKRDPTGLLAPRFRSRRDHPG